MGKPMAARVAASFSVCVYDVKPDRLEDAVARGAVRGRSARDVGSQSDIVSIAVRTPAQVRAVLYDDGLFTGMAAGSTVIIHSTVGHQLVREAGEHARAHDLRLLDVAMSGGPTGAT